MKRVLPLLLTILTSNFSTFAQEPSLMLAGMEMRIGAPQAVIVTYLSKHYDLREIPPGSYLIFEKNPDPNRPRLVGNVGFDKGKLTYACKSWYDEEVGTAYKLVDALHAVLTQMEQRGEAIATIQTKAIREPETTVQEIKLGFGKRWITISIMNHKNSRDVQITESIRFAPFPK